MWQECVAPFCGAILFRRVAAAFFPFLVLMCPSSSTSGSTSDMSGVSSFRFVMSVHGLRLNCSWQTSAIDFLPYRFRATSRASREATRVQEAIDEQLNKEIRRED